MACSTARENIKEKMRFGNRVYGRMEKESSE
jgi:hypothetical protein